MQGLGSRLPIRTFLYPMQPINMTLLFRESHSETSTVRIDVLFANKHEICNRFMNVSFGLCEYTCEPNIHGNTTSCMFPHQNTDRAEQVPPPFLK